MHIQSKLIEANKTVCDLKIGDHYLEGESLTDEQVDNVEGQHVNIQSKLRYTSGFLILKTSFSIQKKVTDQFLVQGDHVQLSFFLNGISRMTEPLRNATCDLDIGIMRRNYFKHYDRRFVMRGGNEVNYIALYLSRDFFYQLVHKEPWAEKDPFIQGVLNGSESIRNDETCAINLPVLRTLEELIHNDYKGLNQRYFTELKLKELLFLSHLQHCQLEVTLRSNQLYTALEKVKAYLVTHLDNPPTIKQLSRMFSLNELKLKQGFKSQFGTTIYAFVIQLRMQKAAKMLLENYSVNEMSALLGYRSVSHFISTYKKYYGETPKKALMKITRYVSILLFACAKTDALPLIF